MLSRAIALFVLTTCLVLTEVQAQDVGTIAPADIVTDTEPVRSHTQGLFLKAHLAGTSLSMSGSDVESGGGFGLKVGYGISRLVTLFAGFDGASMEPGSDWNYSYGLFDIGARFNFRAPEQALIPFLEVAISGQAAAMNYAGSEMVISGAGLTIGGGIQYFLSPSVALDAGLYGTGGSFSRASYRGTTVSFNDERTSSGRFTLGVTFYPLR